MRNQLAACAGTRLVLAALLACAVFVQAAPPSAESSPVGLWRQFDDKQGDLRSIIRIEEAQGELTGTIVRAILRPGEPSHPTCEKCPDEFKDKPIEGLRFLWGLEGQGREWDGGRVLDPENGKIYRVKLHLSEDGQSLEVRGYVGFSLFGRSQRWTRAQPEDMATGSAR